tara:strand:+ start:3979 stop:6018 length:2040 start_codon:yes stop_codon:yes gene_type:complete
MPLISDPDGLSQGGETSVAATTFASAAGAQIVITSANVPAVTIGDFIEVRDATASTEDGLYEVDAYSAGVSITATKQALTGAVVNPVNDAGSVTIRIFGTDANEKNFHFDTTNLKFTFLNGFGSTTVLDDAGVIMQAMYSFMKEEWKNDNDLIKFAFPMTAITPEQFEFNAWSPVDEAESSIVTTDASDTRKLLRTGGWDEVDAAGFVVDSYFCWVTLGTIDALDFAYYFFSSNVTAAISATFDGAVNESVQNVFSVDLSGAGTIAFGTSSTITTTTGNFVTDGFLVDDYVFVQNAEDPANDGAYLITAVATLTLTVTGTPFTTNADDTTVILSVDRRQVAFTTRIRIFGKTYGQSTSTDIGVTVLSNQAFRFPLSETADAPIVDLVATTMAQLLIDIVTTPVAPYNDMAIGWFAADQDRSGFVAIGGDTPTPGDAQFGVIIEADSGGAAGGPPTAEQIYAFVQATLQETTDINDPDARITGEAAVAVIGLLAEPLAALASTGNTLTTLLQVANPGGAGLGVAIDNFDTNDTNRVAFQETVADLRTFPFVAAGTINFNSNLSEDIDAVYRMFFTNDDTGDNTGRDYGTIDAITVNDNTGPTAIAAAVPQLGGGSSVAFDFDYDGNLQRGTGSDATDAPITIVALGLGTGQHVVATGTITRAVGQAFTLVAALERNFSNP